MRKYIIFQADKRQPGWEQRKLQHTQALTWILQENWDSSDKPIPAVGDRPIEFVRVEQLHDRDRHGYSTHYRKSDWEVVRVETYDNEVGRPYAEYDTIVICYCQYSRANAQVSS